MEHQHTEIVLIGNSHMALGILPAVMNDVLPKAETTSLVLYPASLPEYYGYLKELVTSDHPPELIVLETYTFFGDSYVLNGALYPIHNLDLLPGIARHVAPQDQLDWVLPILSNHWLWKDAPTAASFLSAMTHPSPDEAMLLATMHPDAAYFMNRTVMSEEKYTQSVGASPLPIGQYTPWLLAEYAALCRENGVKLMLVNLPAVNQWGAAHEEASALAKQLELPFYDFNAELAAQADYGNLLFVAFDDTSDALNSHMNTLGALVSSLTLAKHVSAMLEVPINETLYAQYQQVVLTDISLHRAEDGTSYTAEIHPLVPSEDTRYDWRVMGRENEQSFAIERQTKTKALSFTFSADAWAQANYLSLRIYHPVLASIGGSLELRMVP